MGGLSTLLSPSISSSSSSGTCPSINTPTFSPFISSSDTTSHLLLTDTYSLHHNTPSSSPLINSNNYTCDLPPSLASSIPTPSSPPLPPPSPHTVHSLPPHLHPPSSPPHPPPPLLSPESQQQQSSTYNRVDVNGWLTTTNNSQFPLYNSVYNNLSGPHSPESDPDNKSRVEETTPSPTRREIRGKTGNEDGDTTALSTPPLDTGQQKQQQTVTSISSTSHPPMATTPPRPRNKRYIYESMQQQQQQQQLINSNNNNSSNNITNNNSNNNNNNASHATHWKKSTNALLKLKQVNI